ncbi:MAG: hypothetical protein KA715_07305 [Xanthomonadaceae bacterium]|nr:hypothetical protein [Xanthomonadaceae bacterium]
MIVYNIKSKQIVILLTLTLSTITSSCFDMGNNGRRPSPIVPGSSSNTFGAVDTDTMWVKASSGTKTFKVHRVAVLGTWNDPTDYVLNCEITVSGSAQDYTCLVEVEELDLFFNGITLQYNIPGSTCNYARVTPFWYYRWQVGEGFKYVRQTIGSPSGATSCTPNTTIIWETSTDGATWVPDVATNSVANEKCQYDYSTYGGPNCCLGKYNYTIRQCVGTSPTFSYNTQSTNGKPWGGDAGKCVDGPGADTKTFARHPQFRVPMPLYKNIESTGISGAITVASPYTQLFSSNVYLANFFDSADHGGGALGPEPMKSFSTVDPLEFTGTPSAYYNFECLDKSSTIKHRIKIMVREWNEKAELDKFMTGSAGNPDTGTAVPDGILNNFRDWKDTSPGNPGAYPKSQQ